VVDAGFDGAHNRCGGCDEVSLILLAADEALDLHVRAGRRSKRDPAG
jgi:hypothetical protein